MDDDHITERMISSGVPLSEPFLQHRLSIFMAEQMKGLKGGKIPVDECYYLMGTADPTGTLKPNEVCVILYVYLLLYIVVPKSLELIVWQFNKFCNF